VGSGSRRSHVPFENGGPRHRDDPRSRRSRTNQMQGGTAHADSAKSPCNDSVRALGLVVFTPRSGVEAVRITRLREQRART